MGADISVPNNLSVNSQPVSDERREEEGEESEEEKEVSSSNDSDGEPDPIDRFDGRENISIEEYRELLEERIQNKGKSMNDSLKDWIIECSDIEIEDFVEEQEDGGDMGSIVDDGEIDNKKITAFEEEEEEAKKVCNLKEASDLIESIHERIQDIMKSFHSYRRKKRYTRGIIYLEVNINKLAKDVSSLDRFFKKKKKGKGRRRFKYLRVYFKVARTQIFDFFSAFNEELEEITKEVRGKVESDPEYSWEKGNEEREEEERIQKQEQARKVGVLTDQVRHEILVEEMITKEYNRELKEMTINMKILHDVMNDNLIMVNEAQEDINSIDKRVKTAVKDVEAATKGIRKAKKNRPRSMFEKAVDLYKTGKKVYKVAKVVQKVM